MDAVELAARHRQVARHAGAGRDHDRVERVAQLVGVDVDADVDAEPELDALGLELLDPPLDDPLLDLEVGDAEADEPAGGLVALVDASPRGRRGAAAARRRGPAGPAPMTATERPVSRAGGCGTIQPSSQARLTIASSICLIVTASPSSDLEHAGGLARRRAEAAGELGEVVRAVQLLDRLAPSGRGRRGRSSRGSGCRAGSRCGRTARRTPCSGALLARARRPEASATNSR